MRTYYFLILLMTYYTHYTYYLYLNIYQTCWCIFFVSSTVHYATSYWRYPCRQECSAEIGIIGGQTRADFFKSLHESAKSASGRLFADFLQTFFMKCRLFADFLQTFSVDHLLSCTLFVHFLHTSCSKWFKLCRLHAHLFCICRLFAEHLHTFCR